jgi:predicted ArsR family transcriptional regulator
MSAANVRHHLTILLADGRIHMTGQKITKARGRPVKFYGLSEKMLGDNLALLSDALLTAWQAGLSSRDQENAVETIAKAWVAQLQPGTQGLPMAKRLPNLVGQLDKQHYQARWEAGAEGPRIIFAHCPFAAIIEKHPELCRMDAAMLAQVSGLSAHQTAKIGTASSPSCIFLLGSNDKT